jgi:hypothetical protein
MFKIKNLINFLMPKLTIISMGGGSSSTTPTLTPEQIELIKAQTGFLTGTAFPAYQEAIGGAKNLYGSSSGNVSGAASNASNVASQTGGLQQAAGSAGLMTGMSGLASLFNPQYEKGQVNAALQAGRESARESQAGQNAMYGGAGGLGSSRMALADANLSSLNAQRQATAAANAQAGVQANKAAAANQLMTAGQANLGAANQAAAAQIAYANSPMDLYSKYASIIYGTPQSSTTPNFTGTQGSNSSGSGFNIGTGK